MQDGREWRDIRTKLVTTFLVPIVMIIRLGAQEQADPYKESMKHLCSSEVEGRVDGCQQAGAMSLTDAVPAALQNRAAKLTEFASEDKLVFG